MLRVPAPKFPGTTGDPGGDKYYDNKFICRTEIIARIAERSYVRSGRKNDR
jgi:hypothetical protein